MKMENSKSKFLKHLISVYIETSVCHVEFISTGHVSQTKMLDDTESKFINIL